MSATETIKKVLANVVQHFTEPEKAQARANIGAAAATDVVNDAVRYSPQTLTTPQQNQARQNINAAENIIASSSNNGLMSSSDKTKLDGIQSGAEANVQSDWNQTNNLADDFIKNKPENLVQDADYVHTDNNFTTAEKTKLSGIEAGAEVNVQSDWSQSDNTADDYIKNKPANLVQDANYVHTDNNFTTTEKNKLSGIEANAEVNVQSDWNQSDNTKDDFIKNKPANLVQDASYVHTDNNFTTTLKNKLDGIAAGAEVNVQSDWSQTDNTKDDYIKNKPSNLVQDASYVHTDNNFTSTLKNKLDGIAAGAEVNVQADWNQTDSSADDYIKNKPTIAAQVNSNWTASSGVSQILNKPNFRRIAYGSTSSELTGLKFDADDPEGYMSVTLDSDQQPAGYLVAGPYKALLDSGLNGLGDSEAGVYIDSNGVFQACSRNVVYVSTSTSYADVLAHVNAGREVILRVYPSSPDLFQDFRLSQKNPDGSMEFTCVRSGSGYVTSYKYGLSSNGQWTRTDTNVSQYTGIQIDGIGRNLHLNQNNYIQTNLPGGLFDTPVSGGNNFERIDGADFAGAYKLACRHNVSGTYEIGIAYTASGTSSTYWFVGTETIIGTDNSVTTKQAFYNGTAYYTPSNRFGGTQSTAFDPSSHNAIIYNGIGLIGPCSDCKIAIFNQNGTIKLAFTAIEVGKVGATN